MPLERLALEPPFATRTLLLLHGLGSDERDLMGLGANLGFDGAIVSLRAPIPYGPGYAWFEIEWTEEGKVIDPEQARSALEMLEEELPSLGRPIVCGFSQGAMMALAAAWRRPDLVSGLALLSGRTLPGFVDGQPAKGFAEVPILVQHGVYDPVIAVDEGREMARAIEASGARPVVREYPMGHEVGMASQQDLAAWLADPTG